MKPLSLVEAVRERREAETRALDLERIKAGLMRDEPRPRPRGRRGMAPEQKERIRELLIKGWSISEVAKEVGSAEKTVWKLRKGLPVERRAVPKPTRIREQALALEKAGKSTLAIAVALHVSEDLVRRALKVSRRAA